MPLHDDQQYLTAVMDSVFISYVCRHADCGFYGSNSDWNKWAFRCPCCGRQCRPYAAKQGASALFPFQKVLTVVDPITQRIFAVPTTWPDTASDSFLGNQAIVQARKMLSEGDADAESRFKSSANASLHDLLVKVGLPPTMQHFKGAQPGVRHILQPATGFGTCSIDRLEQIGYRGAFLPKELAEQPVFDQWDVLCAGLASLILSLPTSLLEYIRSIPLRD